MRTARDPRHKKRMRAVQELFAWEFQKGINLEEILAKEAVDKIAVIDKEIENAAPTWPIKQINRIDLAILRLSIFELIIKKDTPFKVVVDEAVELAKEFGAQSSPGFINGVLGKVINAHQLDKEGISV